MILLFSFALFLIAGFFRYVRTDRVSTDRFSLLMLLTAVDFVIGIFLPGLAWIFWFILLYNTVTAIKDVR